MAEDSKDTASSNEDAEKSSSADSTPPDESKQSGDKITVGNVESSKGVAIGAGASASVMEGGVEGEKADADSSSKKEEKPAEAKAEADMEAKPEPAPTPEKEQAAAASDAKSGDQIEVGDVKDAQAVAVGRGASAVVNNFFQTITAPLRKGPKWLVGLLEWFDTSAVLQALSFLLITAIPTAAAYVTLIQPLVAPCEPLTSDWNVAVMQFTPTGDQPISRSDADAISSRFASSIDAELTQLDETNLVDIRPRAFVPDPVRCRTIRGDTPEERAANAERMAERLNAQVVVYGTVVLEGGSYQVQPEFFVAIDNRYETEEMVGSHAFGRPIPISSSRDNISSEISLNTLLGDRAQALAWITRGLSLYFNHAYDDALAYFEQANQSELWTSSDSREVLYLFQGNAAVRGERIERAKEAYLAALDREPDYARGYAGLASAYYLEALRAGGDSLDPDPDLLDRSEQNFEMALEARVSPQTADVDVKSHFGLGQIYLVRWLIGQTEYGERAVEEFEWVIAQYSNEEEILNPRIREFAAESQARLGLYAVQQGDTEEAVTRYNTAIGLSSISYRQALYWRTLGNLYERDGRADDAEQARRTAISQFEAALPLTSQLIQRAEYHASIAEIYQQLGETTEVRNAWRDAAELAEEAILTADEEDLRGFPEAELAHLRLAEISVDQGSLELAVQDYEAAIEFALDDGKRASYRTALADVYFEIGDDEQALATLESAAEDFALAIEAASDEVDRARHYVALADVHFDLDDEDQAVEALESAVEAYQAAIESADDEVTQARYIVALADVYLTLDDADQALTVLEQALDDLEDEGAQGIISDKLAEIED